MLFILSCSYQKEIRRVLRYDLSETSVSVELLWPFWAFDGATPSAHTVGDTALTQDWCRTVCAH